MKWIGLGVVVFMVGCAHRQPKGQQVQVRDQDGTTLVALDQQGDVFWHSKKDQAMKYVLALLMQAEQDKVALKAKVQELEGENAKLKLPAKSLGKALKKKEGQAK